MLKLEIYYNIILTHVYCSCQLDQSISVLKILGIYLNDYKILQANSVLRVGSGAALFVYVPQKVRVLSICADFDFCLCAVNMTILKKLTCLSNYRFNSCENC